MEYYETEIGRPIFNLQTFLRSISKVNENIYPVIPDGIFGEDTKRSVESFQLAYNLPVTGEVNSDTWEKIISEYEKYIKSLPSENGVNIITSEKVIYFGENDSALLIVQAMIFSLSKLFSNIPSVEITGIYDEKTKSAIIITKELFGLSGEQIDKEFIGELSDLYEHAVVYKKDFYPEIIKEQSNVESAEDNNLQVQNEESDSSLKTDTQNDEANNNVIVWKFF